MPDSTVSSSSPLFEGNCGVAFSPAERHRTPKGRYVGRRQRHAAGARPGNPYCTVICLSVRLASKCSTAGHTGQLTPSDALFGSPVRANAPMLSIIAFDRARRPALFAVLFCALENTFGP